MRTMFLSMPFCRIMPAKGHAFTLPEYGASWLGRGSRHLIPVLPNGDPLETGGSSDRLEESPETRPSSLPDYPTDVPAPEPHDPPAWQPIDDPPPDVGEPAPNPRPIP
jgi:hypothetical protein